MQDASTIERIRRKFDALGPVMDERTRRQWAAAEAAELGWGGVSAVADATGLSRTTITAGLRELRYRAEHPEEPTSPRIRRPGGGPKRLTETDPGLLAALEGLVDPVTRGAPDSPLRWTCKSTRRLADELTRQGHPVCPRTVAARLADEPPRNRRPLCPRTVAARPAEASYSIQRHRKTRERGKHPDRNAQFE